MSYSIAYSGNREQVRLAAFSDAMNYLSDAATRDKLLKGCQAIINDESMAARHKVNWIYMICEFTGIPGTLVAAIRRTPMKMR